MVAIAARNSFHTNEPEYKSLSDDTRVGLDSGSYPHNARFDYESHLK